MAKNKKDEKNKVAAPKLSIWGTQAAAKTALKIKEPTKEEKQQIQREYGEKKETTPKDATALGQGPVSVKKATEIQLGDSLRNSSTVFDSPPSFRQGGQGKISENRAVDNVKYVGAVQRAQKEQRKRAANPYSNMTYRQMTDDIHNTYGGELRRGNIGQFDYYMGRSKYDRERIEKASRSELEEMLKEKESEYNYLFGISANPEERRTTSDGRNYRELAWNRVKELDVLTDEIESRIRSIDEDDALDRNYNASLLNFGKKALDSGGDGKYVPTKYGLTDYDTINRYKNGEIDENVPIVQELINKPIGHLSDGELKLYNTLYNNNPDEAEEYLKSIEGTLNKRLTEYQTQEAYKYGQAHPYIGGAKSVAKNVTTGAAAAVDNLIEGITGDVNTYDTTSRVLRESQALRQGGNDYFIEKYGEKNGKRLGFFYNTGLSITENLANVLLFKGAGKAASGLIAANMASNAAANSMIDIADRGGNDFQILAGGVASGAAEYLFEKYSVERLFDIKNTKGILNTLKAAGTQAGIEGSEEIFTEVANIISDAVIMQNNSQSNQKLREYVMQGMSYEDASKKVFRENINQIAEAGAAGMLSGAVMGGGAVAMDNASRQGYMKSRGEQLANNPTAMSRILQYGIENGNSDARYADELLREGGKLDGKNAGQILESVLNQSLEKDGGMVNIIRAIDALEGRGSDYIGSKESIDTAKAVMHMAQGQVTDVDRALLGKSDGAVTLLSVIEENDKALGSIRKAAGEQLRVQNSEYGVRNEDISASQGEGERYKYAEVYSNGERMTIPEGSRIVKNIVLDDESIKVRRRDEQAYKNVEMLAQDLGMRVRYVNGLTDSAGNALDGVITSQGIFINSEAENPSRFAATHEFSHRMKQVSSEQWQKYQDFVIKKLKTDGRYSKVFDKKAAAYNNSNADYINEEIAADYIGELFTSENELADFIRESRRDAVTIRDVWYKILDKLGLLDEKKKAQQLWRNAYKAAVKSVEEGSAGEFTGEVKYSKEYTFNKQVDDALANRIKRGFSVYVGKLPKLLEKCGLNPELPMLMHPSHIRDINHEKSEDNIHYHGISDEVIKQIPELLKYPAMIYDSISEDNRENSICVLTTQCDSEGAPIIIVITNSAENGRYLDVKMEVQKTSASSHVDTMYGKDGFSYHIDSIIDQDAVLYVSKDGFNKLLNRKNLRLNSDGKLRLLARLDNLRFDTIIHQSNNVVNTNSMLKVEKDARKSVSGARISDIEGESATLAKQATPHPSAMPTPSPQGEGLKGEALSTEVTRLETENAELRKQLENLHIQLNQTEGKGLDQKAIKKAAQKMRSSYGSKISVSALHQELAGIYNYMSGRNVDSDELSKRIHGLAQKVIENATERIDTGSEYSELLDRIRTARIEVPKSERADFTDGYEQFRKGNMGKLTLVNDGVPLDVFWDELCEEYPHFFSEDIIGSQERLERILEMREELRPVEESIYHSDEEFRAAVLALENDIMESFYNIPESDSTKFIFYDKRAAITEKKLQEREAQLYDNIDKMKKRHAAELEKSRKFAAKQQQLRGRDKIKRKIDSDYNYISRMVKNPTDARHVPEDMRASVAYLLDCFNFETVQLDNIKDAGKEADSPTAVRLDNMHKAYAEIIRKAWGVDSDATKNNLLDEHLNEDIQALRDEIPLDESGEFKRMQDMSVEELRVVSKVLTSVHYAITQRNKAFNKNMKDSISELGEQSISDMQGVREQRRGSGEKLDYRTGALDKAVKMLDNYINFNNVQPWDFFHGMGSTLERLYMEERKAFDRHIENIREASDKLQNATEGLDLKKLTGKHAEKQWFKTESGEELRLSKGQILSLYALYQRNQGKEHLLGGGIVTNAEARNSQGNKTSANGAHKITELDLGMMFETLSEDEKCMVREVVEFLSKRCSAWGNETSMKLYGYEKFGEGWYFPIKVSNQTLNTYYGEKGEGSLRSQGFTKQLVKNAKNAVEVGDFFDIVTNHINGMSLYNTVAIPMLDLERVLNYTQSGADTKVRGEIIKTFGKSAEKYIETFHKDVNGSNKTDDKDEVIEKLTGNAKKASIGLNARVFLQQPTSVARALLFLSPIDFRSVQGGITLQNEMRKNIPIAYWKSVGFRDIGTGSTIKEVLLDNESLYSKVSMGLYGKADDFTWAWIYGAVKNEISRKNPDLDKNSKQFTNKVRERFNYIVDRSQVVDSVFHRTQIMRSGNAYTKTATMFMSEPLKTYNMYRTELLDAINNSEVSKKTARATAVFIVSNLLLSAAQALPDTWREDDDKELFRDGKEIPLWERFLKKFGEDMTDNSNPMTYLPYIKDIWSMIQGFTQERIEYSNLTDLISSSKELFNGKRTITYRVLNFAKPASAVVGISAGNLIRDTKTIASTIYRMIGDEYADYMLEKFDWNVKNEDNKSRFMKHYKRALQNGHSEDAATILADYMAETFPSQNFEHKRAEKVIGEMSKLYGKTDSDSKLFYDLPDESFRFDKNEYSIPEGEYPEYVSGAYKKLFDLAYEMVTDKRYKELSDEDKVRSFGEIRSYAEQAQRMEDVEGYELSGWEKEVYNGETDYMDSVIERLEEREYQKSRDKYKDSFEYDESDFSAAELNVMEKVESDYASYYASVDEEREYNEKTLRHIAVYDEKLKDEMSIEEYAGIRAYAKKTAAMADGKESMKKNELKAYLDSTDYSLAVKRALFEAIGNSNWKNPY